MASYDQDIRNFDDPMTKATPDHYVDLQNAAALLWRLEQLGLDVGDRWEELADKAEARIGEAGHLLMVPHLMLALVATGRDAAAARFVAALRELAADPRCGPRRRSPMWSFRYARRRRRIGAAIMPGWSICWRRARTRSACSAAATRSATCSSRC